MVPSFPHVVGVYWVDDVFHFYVGYVLDFDFLGYPFGGVEVMVEEEEEEEEEECSVAVVVVAEEGVHHGSLVVVVRYSLAGRHRPRHGCWVTVFFVCNDVGVWGLQSLGV